MMTFDDWWAKNWPDFPHMHFAREVWNAATASERQRCREIALKTKDQYASSSWKCCAENIADEIGE